MRWLDRQPYHLDARFVLRDFEPVYVETWRQGLLETKVEQALGELEECRICPRNCGINRLKDEQRVCHTGRHAIVSSAFPHFGEEDCLRGTRGSGTIFFGLCNLRCVFCQNWDISQKQAGAELDAHGIAELALDLQTRGCHNINFVTPEHVVPQVVEALAIAIPQGPSQVGRPDLGLGAAASGQCVCGCALWADVMSPPNTSGQV